MRTDELKDVAVVHEPMDQMVSGIDTLSRTVQATLGPAGQFVGLEMKIGPPTYTKDGVTVAQHVWSPDPVENSAIRTVVGAALEMNHHVGDGTTTAVILAVELAKQLLKLKGKDYQETLRHLKDYLNTATDAVKEHIQDDVPGDVLLDVATVSCNGDREIAKIVSDAVMEVGKDGVVTFQDSPSGEPYYEISPGIVIDRGYATAHFTTKDDAQGKIDFGGKPDEACFVFVSADGFAEADEVLPLLETAQATGQPFLIIAPEVTGNALGMLIINRKKGVAHSCAVRAPASGEERLRILEDIAVATGGRVFATNQGKDIREFTQADVLEYSGKAGRVIVSDKRTIIIDAGAEDEDVDAHIEQLHELAAQNPFDKKKYEKRIAFISGGIGTVFVPGYNSAEKGARRFLVEDGIAACMAALRGGVVPGGCCSFKKMIQVVSEDKPEGVNQERARDIFLKVVKRPMELLISNAVEGGNPSDGTYAMMTQLISKKAFDQGLNVRTMTFGNLPKMGVWEPALVPLTALKIAFGCATTLGNTRAMIVQDKAKK